MERGTVNPVRIVYISKLAPHLGMRRIHEVGRRLVAWGHELTVLSAATTQGQPFEELVDGMRVIALPTVPRRLRRNDRIGFLLTRMPFYIVAPRFVGRGGVGPLDVLVEDVAPLRSPGLSAAAANLGVPLVLQVHAVFPTLRDWIHAYGPMGIIGVLNERSLRRGRDYDGLYSDASSTLRSLAVDIGGSVRMRWIPNGVDADRFCPPRHKPEPRGRLKLLAVGRLVGLKNLDVLIRAVGSFKERLHLNVIGDGPLRRQLQALVSQLGLDDTVRLAGRVSEDDLVRAYQDSDVFVHPSLIEGMPLSVLEAMASALPVVMNDIDAAVIVRPEFGWLTPSADTEGWRKALSELLRVDPHELRERGMRARKVCEAEFVWDVTARRELEFFQEVLAEKRR